MVERVVAIIGELDQYGDELRFLRDRVRTGGCDTLVIDLGVAGQPAFPPDVEAREVAAAAGANLDALLAEDDREALGAALGAGAAHLVADRFREGHIHAIVGFGGFQVTTIGVAVMRGLPVGVPKLMICSHVSGEPARFAGTRDIMMMTSGLHFAGLDRLSAEVLANAAAAVVGMTLRPPIEPGES